eukprot:303237-Alexandrium_andersonii.AAC.1
MDTSAAPLAHRRSTLRRRPLSIEFAMIGRAVARVGRARNAPRAHAPLWPSRFGGGRPFHLGAPLRVA